MNQQQQPFSQLPINITFNEHNGRVRFLAEQSLPSAQRVGALPADLNEKGITIAGWGLPLDYGLVLWDGPASYANAVIGDDTSDPEGHDHLSAVHLMYALSRNNGRGSVIRQWEPPIVDDRDAGERIYVLMITAPMGSEAADGVRDTSYFANIETMLNSLGDPQIAGSNVLVYDATQPPRGTGSNLSKLATEAKSVADARKSKFYNPFTDALEGGRNDDNAEGEESSDEYDNDRGMAPAKRTRNRAGQKRQSKAGAASTKSSNKAPTNPNYAEDEERKNTHYFTESGQRKLNDVQHRYCRCTVHNAVRQLQSWLRAEAREPGSGDTAQSPKNVYASCHMSVKGAGGRNVCIPYINVSNLSDAELLALLHLKKSLPADITRFLTTTNWTFANWEAAVADHQRIIDADTRRNLAALLESVIAAGNAPKKGGRANSGKQAAAAPRSKKDGRQLA